MKQKLLVDSCPWNSPGQNTGVGSLSLLHGIFLTQESNQDLLHCRWILYWLSYQGSPLWPHSHLLFHGQQGQRYCLYQGPAIFPMYIILCCICHGLFQNSGVYMVILLLGLVMNSTQHLLLTEAPRGLLQTP